ncbi:MAG: sigma-70 family RNA polymerase sigma factor [Thermovirgaceae bacterium]|nr:sigma-70 family RNA polymerase sigma factor [Thermovirgaceae bacterium]
MDDDLLMLQFASGNEKAMETLYKCWAPRIMAYAGRCLGDFHEAQDVAQESFMMLSKSAVGYEPRGRFGAYLFRIAGNIVRSRCRKKAPLLGVMDELYDGPNDEGIAEETAMWRIDLESALEKLPADQREALLLVVCGGLSYDEAALVQGVSQDALAQRVSRSRKGLYRMLSGKGMEGGSLK